MTVTAKGTFSVKMTPQPADETGAGSAVGRFLLDKEFQGDLEGTSKGEMLAISTAVPGSAGYVAMERVTGTLKGRTGTFALLHTGIMSRGTPDLSVTVVPDSGTEGLEGLSGTLVIKVEDGNHLYELAYELSATN